MAARAKRFTAPAKCQVDCKTVIIKELDGNDEIAAAVEADKRTGQPGFRADNFTAMMKLERQEKIRQAIVAVDNKVMKPGEPFAGLDAFHAPTKLWVASCFDVMNSLEGDDLKKSLDEAKDVDLTRLTSGEAATDEPSGG